MQVLLTERFQLQNEPCQPNYGVYPTVKSGRTIRN